ncbi:tyrosine phosphatase family-domain-containing protein [Radiomyces spectabilis]|uniref:tyrosine phosphatase family-domain-containing protein n=1 Tax=Radiomyces spectabilis TaxID=64574 RepID=UPI00221F342C|nr:tyrosine phosphatase family-domain-containing protein [Radiomyces spectabilis]KAI8391054.1 tyrosine phosphatase family-domain-containing protein [Radiomyces spectabilis]
MGQHVGLCIPRWIDVEGVKNFRDIGGWPVKDGSGYIRERVVFRCGHLTDITDQGIRTLQELNVVAIFDFRSDMEINYHGGIREIPGTTYYESAIFKDVDFSPENMGQTMGRFLEGTEGFILVYLTMLEKAKDQYRKILLHMIEHHSRDTRDALIIHCTAGKDRTGLFCMMLLGLCGVDDEIIAREYALTNLGFWESEEDMRRKANRAGVPLEHMKAAMSAP